MTTVW